MEIKYYSVKLMSKESGISTRSIYKYIKLLNIKEKCAYTPESYKRIVDYFRRTNKISEQKIVEVNWYIYQSKMNF